MLIILYLCINQTLSMNTIRSQIIALLLLISGIVLLGGGVWGFYSLYAISHRYEHTTGTIRTLQIQKIYRYRKIRYKKEMQIAYSTDKYGDLFATRISYWPLRSVGDKVSVWYHPHRPHEIRLPESECMLWGLLVASGFICMCGSVVFWKTSKTADISEG